MGHPLEGTVVLCHQAYCPDMALRLPRHPPRVGMATPTATTHRLTVEDVVVSTTTCLLSLILANKLSLLFLPSLYHTFFCCDVFFSPYYSFPKHCFFFFSFFQYYFDATPPSSLYT
jgi:hypothetical protein